MTHFKKLTPAQVLFVPVLYSILVLDLRLIHWELGKVLRDRAQ